MCNSVVSSICTVKPLISELFIISKRNPISIINWFPFFTPPLPWEPLISFLSLWICLFWMFHNTESYNVWTFVSGSISVTFVRFIPVEHSRATPFWTPVRQADKTSLHVDILQCKGAALEGGCLTTEPPGSQKFLIYILSVHHNSLRTKFPMS